MSKWARRRDTSHAEVREQLVELGWRVKDVANCANFVDLVIFHPALRHLGNVLVEAKKPGKERKHIVGAFTPSQQQMEADGFEIVVLTSKEEARAWHRRVSGETI